MEKEKKPPLREAVAIEYAPGSDAPVIIASGKGHVAERIIETAKENSVSIYEDPDLAHTLNLLKIGEEIPPELYSVVAQILIFVSDMDKKAEWSGAGTR
jgi:flagellar biosynthesis protein